MTLFESMDDGEHYASALRTIEECVIKQISNRPAGIGDYVYHVGIGVGSPLQDLRHPEDSRIIAIVPFDSRGQLTLNPEEEAFIVTHSTPPRDQTYHLGDTEWQNSSRFLVVDRLRKLGWPREKIEEVVDQARIMVADPPSYRQPIDLIYLERPDLVPATKTLLFARGRRPWSSLAVRYEDGTIVELRHSDRNIANRPPLWIESSWQKVEPEMQSYGHRTTNERLRSLADADYKVLREILPCPTNYGFEWATPLGQQCLQTIGLSDPEIKKQKLEELLAKFLSITCGSELESLRRQTDAIGVVFQGTYRHLSGPECWVDSQLAGGLTHRFSIPSQPREFVAQHLYRGAILNHPEAAAVSQLDPTMQSSFDTLTPGSRVLVWDRMQLEGLSIRAFCSTESPDQNLFPNERTVVGLWTIPTPELLKEIIHRFDSENRQGPDYVEDLLRYTQAFLRQIHHDVDSHPPTSDQLARAFLATHPVNTDSPEMAQLVAKAERKFKTANFISVIIDGRPYLAFPARIRSKNPEETSRRILFIACSYQTDCRVPGGYYYAPISLPEVDSRIGLPCLSSVKIGDRVCYYDEFRPADLILRNPHPPVSSGH